MTIANVKVTNYEKELVDKLRLEKYFGIPLSIVLLSQPMCIGKAHHRAIQLTKGMDEFKIVSGNINTLPKDYYPNHSWVENNGWVYDTTNGKNI